MSAPLSPDLQLSRQENELICEKLLGWKRYVPDAHEGQDRRWKRAITLPGITGDVKEATPSFTTWADAGLILEALKARGMDRLELSVDDEGDWKCVVEWDRHQMHRSRYSSESAPLAVRKVALSYIEAARL